MANKTYDEATYNHDLLDSDQARELERSEYSRDRGPYDSGKGQAPGHGGRGPSREQLRDAEDVGEALWQELTRKSR